MHAATLALACSTAAAANVAAAAKAKSGAEVTPVQKVLELLQGMLAKGKEEKHAEEVQFSTFNQFCGDTSAEKTGLIADANKMIMKLTADIEKYAADIGRLGQEIDQHQQDISTWNGEINAATDVRATQKADYDLMHKDQSESIDALDRAINVLKKEDYTRSQAASLVQLTQLVLIPPEAKRTINVFLQHGAEGGLDAPEAAGYEFQSGGIIEMLTKLMDQFMAERTQLENEERNQLQAYVMTKKDLEGSIAQATQDVNEKTQTKGEKTQARAVAEGDRADTTATRDADQKYLDDLTATCQQKASDFADRQQLRADEIVAISKAIEIISSGDVAGSADKHLPAMLQTKKKATSLGQLRVDSEGVSKARAVAYLQQMAKRLNSQVLSTLATKASDDPFVKVRKMIKDLIVRLMEEANEEAEHKGWCDTELTTNEQTRTEKTNAVEKLRAEIDELEASIAKLSEQVTTLTSAVADLDAAMAKATEIRSEEHATNSATTADAKAAQDAVNQAMAVIKDFYAKAGDAVALFAQQSQQPTAPEIFDKTYKGQQSAGGNVVGFLEVILSDFARLQAETEAAEKTAQDEYDAFMTDSQVDKDSKVTDIGHKSSKKSDQSNALTERNADLDGTQKELDAALAYFDKLKPSCVDAGATYDDRVSRREEEIQSLKEALEILEGKSV